MLAPLKVTSFEPTIVTGSGWAPDCEMSEDNTMSPAAALTIIPVLKSARWSMSAEIVWVLEELLMMLAVLSLPVWTPSMSKNSGPPMVKAPAPGIEDNVVDIPASIASGGVDTDGGLQNAIELVVVEGLPRRWELHPNPSSRVCSSFHRLPRRPT